MKKISLLVCALCLVINGISAQIVVSDNIDGSPADSHKKTESTESSVVDGMDLAFKYSPKSETFTFAYGEDLGKIGYWTAGFLFGGPGDISMYSYTVGFGLRKRYISNDMLLVQGKVYPYLGYSSVSYRVNGKSQSDANFAYGLTGNIAIGLKLCKVASGKSMFLTVGYSVSAPSFKFKGLFDNGGFGLGITVAG